MKSFISSIFLRTNSVSDEKICIGLLAVSAGNSRLEFSEKKIRNSGLLLNKDSRANAIRLLKQTKKSLPDIESSCLSVEYFDYLSKLHNGFLSFTEPNPIPREISNNDFRKLFKTFVGMDLDVPKHKGDTLHQVVHDYIRRNAVFKEKADIDFELTNEIIPSIYSSNRIDLISCNGGFFVGKSIDFTTTETTITNNLHAFRAVVVGLNVFAKNSGKSFPGDYKVYHNDPDYNEARSILDKVRKDETSGFTLVPVEQIDKDANKLESGDYRKFSEMLDL